MKDDNDKEENNNSSSDEEENSNKNQKLEEMKNIITSNVDETPENNKPQIGENIPVTDIPKQNFTPYTKDPYLDSNFINRFFLYWAYKIIRIATKTKIKIEHLGNLNKKNDSTYFNDRLTYIWETKGYKNCRKYALLKAILRSNLPKISVVFILSMIKTATDYIGVILIKLFIDYFDTNADKSSFMYNLNLWELGGLFLLSQIIGSFVEVHNCMIESVVGNRAGFELDCFIYNKILRACPSSFTQRATEGEIVNFVQVDAMRLSWMIITSPNVFANPIQIIAYSYLLFDFFSFSFFGGLGVMIIFFGINFKISQLFHKYQKRMLKKKDLRMKASTETFENIKILKLYSWEKQFMQKVLDARKEEMDAMRTRFNVTTSNISLFWLCPSLVACGTLGLYQYLNDKLSISTMLIGLSLFNKLQGPIRALPGIINNIIECSVSMKRIEKFIRQPEIIEKHLHKESYNPNLEYAIKIEGGSFSWGVKQEEKKKVDDDKKDNKKKNKKEDCGVDVMEEKSGFYSFTNGNDTIINDLIEEKNMQNVDSDNDSDKENEQNNKEKLDLENYEEYDDKPADIDDKLNSHRETKKNIEDLNVPLVTPSERETNAQNIDTNVINKNEKKRKEYIKDGCKIEIPFPRHVPFDVTLKNINIEVKNGEILGIIGEVGSGKSSLLQAFLNGLILLNPKSCDGIHINGRVGYSAQIPWIQNDTIRNNILFFNEYDQEKYENILNKCQLKYDLDNFEGKDLTEIGEKGVNLSGGQKVRISLARTVYNDPDIYLFDDPISALDANIGKKIMKELIINYLKGKTRVVVTHALQYLKYMDRIIYMQNGKIEWVGTYKEILNQEFFNTMKKLSKLNSEKSFNDSDGESKDEKRKNKNNNANSGKEVKIIKEEDEEIGSVKMGVYLNYSQYMGGNFFLLMIIFIMSMWQANKGGSDLWLAFWSKPENQTKSENDQNSKWIFYSIYCALNLASVIYIFLRIYLLTVGIIRLGRYLHKDMIVKLIRAPINLFHETIPRGQIFNRLSKDLDALNFSIFSVGDTLVCFLSCVGSFILCAIYDLYAICYMPIVFVIGYFITRFYLKGSRPLTRLEAISRSPILNTISETIPGFASIKAFGKEEDYLKKYYKRINDCFNTTICIRGINMWLQEMFRIISIFYLVYLISRTCFNADEATSQSVGITFTYSVVLQENLGWSFSIAANVENTMISLERCIKYTKIDSEKPLVIKNKDNELIEKNWPQEGKIRFENYYVKYRPNTEIVLKNLNFEIDSREKVGVVGRTGSGKSTICLCLFRILEPLKGTIYIDNEDITKIGLEILRKNITIIPQDPCLMEGSLKYNIDPFNKTDNEEIVSILKKIGFEYTEDDDKILDRKIEQGGSNLSVGEKQLVCIARAILRKTRIVVMDEATANIDMRTEEKIQKALGLVFMNSTVITVAHRIKTIINYDKILVLNNGKIEEFDSPQNLLKNENSLFYQLYSKSTM